MRRNTLVILTLLTLLALGTLLSPSPAQAQTGGSEVGVRFVHALPGGGEVDIYINDSLVVAGAAFGEATPHLRLPTGEHTLSLFPAGAPSDTAPFLRETLSLAAPSEGIQQSLIIHPGADGPPQIAISEDRLTASQLGQASLHVVHTIPGVDPIDIIGANGAPIAQGIAFNTPSGTVNPPVSSWELLVTPTGGTPDLALAEVGVVNFNTGMLYKLIVAGTADDPSVIRLETPLLPPLTTETIRARIAHGSSDAPAVDLYVNDETKIIVGLEPGMVTPHIALPTGDVSIIVREAGSPPNSEAVASARLNISSSTGAATIVAVGALSDDTFTFSIYEDDVAGLDSSRARVVVINTVPTGPADVALDEGTPLASSLSTYSASEAVDLEPGVYNVVASVSADGDTLELNLDEQVMVGGAHYTLLVYANASAGVSAAETALVVSENSLPGAMADTGVAAAVDTSESASTETTSASAGDENTNDPQSGSDASNATDTSTTDTTETSPDTAAGTGQDTASAQQPTATPAPFDPAPAGPQQQNDRVLRGTVNLDEGVNLHCREYPSPEAFSLDLIPNNTVLEIIGYAGPSDEEVQRPFVPVEEGSFADPREDAESFEDIWLSTLWAKPDGGSIDCWIRADFVILTYRNELITEVDEFFALEDLEIWPPVIVMVPYNYPAIPVDTVPSPPTPVVEIPVATVNLDRGVNLHLRRQPSSDSESLTLVPNGAQLVVIERTTGEAVEVVEEEPDGEDTTDDEESIDVDSTWLFVEFTDADRIVRTGWVLARYTILSLGGEELELSEIPVADTIQTGEELGLATPAPDGNAGASSGTTGSSTEVTGTISIPEGANLNMYEQPDANSALVRSLGNGATVTVLGRNTDGSWLNVRYEAIGEGTWVGWVTNTGDWVSLPVPVESLPVVN
ncbi:MAG: DUF4397 domain-containing protein [Chloroflexi bacterium]|nr:DUF4397 domain-containing protein [Chloroflexota bacterium]